MPKPEQFEIPSFQTLRNFLTGMIDDISHLEHKSAHHEFGVRVTKLRIISKATPSVYCSLYITVSY